VGRAGKNDPEHQSQAMPTFAIKLVLSALLALVLLELGLRLFTVFPIHSPSANRRVDSVLMYTMDPGRLDGIDEFGFRNEGTRVDVEVVAIGDSHTYGYNVSAEDAWPQQLARMSGLKTCNLGVGGYGVLQYVRLLEEAWAMAPRHVVLGLYLANDLQDVCAVLRQSDFWRRWAAQQGFDISATTTAVASATVQKASVPAWAAIRRQVARTALGSCAAYYSGLWQRPGTNAMLTVDLPGIETRLGLERISWHGAWVDTNRAEIAEALNILTSVMAWAQEQARRHRIDFSIALFPSKENAYFGLPGLPSEGWPETVRESVARERSLNGEVLRIARSQGIRVVDMQPAMSAGLQAGTRLYPRHNEFHPVADGYAIYARTLFDRLIRTNGAPVRAE
jgi:lysophospholipase L1-like esterase